MPSSSSQRHLQIHAETLTEGHETEDGHGDGHAWGIRCVYTCGQYTFAARSLGGRACTPSGEVATDPGTPADASVTGRCAIPTR